MHLWARGASLASGSRLPVPARNSLETEIMYVGLLPLLSIPLPWSSNRVGLGPKQGALRAAATEFSCPAAQ